jgi:FkbM family methyltransferase
MYKQIRKLLMANSVTRRLGRRIVGSVKSTINCPDAFIDLTSLIQRTSPDAVLDIGSHIGETIARILETNRIPIHGFEPTPATFDRLSKRFEGNSLISLHNIALSDKHGEATFHCNANEQTNSLLDNDQGNRELLAEHTRHINKQTIQTIRLDDWMAQHLPSAKVVIKCDVQGAEGLLLAGGMSTFREQVIGFYSEAQIASMYEGQMGFFDMHRILTTELGFALHNVYPCFHDKHGRALQTDAFWINEKYLGLD